MRIIGIGLLALICFSLEAQDISAGLETGYGTYSMRYLRMLETAPQGIAIPYEQLQDFPATPFIRAMVRMQVKDKWQAGLVLGYLTTGSRSAYSDYSGRAINDVIVRGFQLGCSNAIQLYSTGPYSLNARINFGALFNSVEFQRSIELTDPAYYSAQNFEFSSFNTYITFGGEVARQIKRFAIHVFAEYELNNPGAEKLKSSNTAAAPSGFDVDWSGARIGLSCSFNFSKAP